MFGQAIVETRKAVQKCDSILKVKPDNYTISILNYILKKGSKKKARRKEWL